MSADGQDVLTGRVIIIFSVAHAESKIENSGFYCSPKNF